MAKKPKHPTDPTTQHTPDELLERAYALGDDTETHALYRDWATSYDTTMLDGLAYLTPSRTAAMLHSYLSNKPTTTPRILDVGCGTGLAGTELEKLGYDQIDGLDYSAEMLDVARGRSIYSKLFEADLNGPLALPDATYDALICTGTFTHGHVGAECLDELFRILAPGGLFACTVHDDVWQPMGFDEKITALQASGELLTLEATAGPYFATDEKPEGTYFIWQKAGSPEA